MSKLLPSNNLLREQDFAGFVDKSLMHDNSVITLDPMMCHSSLLEHIALGFDVSISNMSELEARKYLSSIANSNRGTVQAVEDAVKSIFDDVELGEWFDKDLEVGAFDVDITLGEDNSYTAETFAKAKKLIDKNKNVRSFLNAFNVAFPNALGEIQTTNALNYKIDVTNDVLINKDVEANIEFYSGVRFDFDFNQNLDLTTNVDIKTQGGVMWQI